MIACPASPPAGRAPHGARGLKYHRESVFIAVCQCRAPHGARGLKFEILVILAIDFVSRPARGAWIEIVIAVYQAHQGAGRAPHGARGLKFHVCAALRGVLVVAPRTGRVD